MTAEAKAIPILGVWLGMAAWYGEYGILAFRRFVLLEKWIWYPRSVWLAALTYVVGFGLIGIGLAALVRRSRSKSAHRIAVQSLATLAVLSVLLTFRNLHKLAILILALGIGMQLGAMVEAHGAAVVRRARTSLPVLLAIASVVCATVIGWDPVREQLALSRLGAAAPGAPNVLFIILDTVRADALSLYGYGRPTSPSIRSIAAEGVTFDAAVSTAPWTLPAHFSFFTGLFVQDMPDETMNDPDHAFDPTTPFLAEVLSERGYATAGFVANASYTTDEFGLDRGFTHWADTRLSLGQLAISTSIGRLISVNGRWRRLLGYYDYPIRKHAADVNEELLSWLSRRRDRPFFVFANYFDAHSPYLPPERFEKQFVASRPDPEYAFYPHHTDWLRTTGVPAAEVRAERDEYDATIAALDERIGVLFDELERRGLLDNTLVVIASDHGEGFNEHGRIGHGQLMYMNLLRVPLVIRYPGRVPQGVRISEPVTLADIPATILDLIGIGEGVMPGHSLTREWRPGSEREGSPSPILSRERTGEGRPESLVIGTHHYIRHPSGDQELYDLLTDPGEQRNLADDPKWAALLATMGAALDGGGRTATESTLANGSRPADGG